MFRKVSHIIVSLLLLTTTMGFSVSKHYCGPRVVSVSINHDAESCCDMEGTSNCCQTETKVFQFDKDFVPLSVTAQDQVKVLDLFFIPYINVTSILKSSEVSEEFIPGLPPPKDLQKVLSNLQTYLC